MEYQMGLQKKYFNDMKYNTKKVELRINDEKRQKLKIGDIIDFKLEPKRNDIIKTRIVNVTKYANFIEAVDSIPTLYLTSDSKESYLRDLNHYYNNIEQAKYGVLAIEIEVVENESLVG